MKNDPHKKRQKQIRMSDEVRKRFEKAQKESGLSGEDFISHLLDKAEGKNDISNEMLLEILRAKLK